VSCLCQEDGADDAVFWVLFDGVGILVVLFRGEEVSCFVLVAWHEGDGVLVRLDRYEPGLLGSAVMLSLFRVRLLVVLFGGGQVDV